MTSGPTIISIHYDPFRLIGRLSKDADYGSSIWERIKAKAIADGSSSKLEDNFIELPWQNVLNIIREYGSKALQSELDFRFRPHGKAAELIRQFSVEIQQARKSRAAPIQIDKEEVQSKLVSEGFNRRQLKAFQLRDVSSLLGLPHGANFSVPGAGKTTVTFALHFLLSKPELHLLVIGPKSAFGAWKEIVDLCTDRPDRRSQFVVLEGNAADNERLLRSGATRFLISYDLAVRQSNTIANYLATTPVHLVLDEAHRMKAGMLSQRGAFLLGIASLPFRRDILTGTPMPQGPTDLAAQLGFLWPGQGLENQLYDGITPREVLGNLFVRTTKSELGLPPVQRSFIKVGMAPGHLALYSTIRDETLRQLSKAVSRTHGEVDFIRARRSVMRLLQLSTNPTLALQSIVGDSVRSDAPLLDQVLSEGPSLKMRAVEKHVRELAHADRKVVVWTIFTDTLLELERMLADLNPVTLYGAVDSGDASDSETREGRIARFHNETSCKVLIANPAAASEGISLHTVCHDAIYVDRSYVSTHYLQSIDRIHRLGLPKDTKTNIFIYQTQTPAGIGSVDYSVNRRLAKKIRGLQQLLDDPDLHEIALDEEEAVEPIDYDVEFQDIIDLLEELEGRAEVQQDDE